MGASLFRYQLESQRPAASPEFEQVLSGSRDTSGVLPLSSPPKQTHRTDARRRYCAISKYGIFAIWHRNLASNGTTPRTGSNRTKHGVSFAAAQAAFFDPRRIIAEDLKHSGAEPRYFCFGVVTGGVMTVRFTYRAGRIRIFGAGYWRKGRRIYEQQNR